MHLYVTNSVLELFPYFRAGLIFANVEPVFFGFNLVEYDLNGTTESRTAV